MPRALREGLLDCGEPCSGALSAMRFLFAAVAGFLLPCVASTAFLLAIGVPVVALVEDLAGQVLTGLMAAARS